MYVRNIRYILFVQVFYIFSPNDKIILNNNGSSGILHNNNPQNNNDTHTHTYIENFDEQFDKQKMLLVTSITLTRIFSVCVCV